MRCTKGVWPRHKWCSHKKILSSKWRVNTTLDRKKQAWMPTYAIDMYRFNIQHSDSDSWLLEVLFCRLQLKCWVSYTRFHMAQRSRWQKQGRKRQLSRKKVTLVATIIPILIVWCSILNNVCCFFNLTVVFMHIVKHFCPGHPDIVWGRRYFKQEQCRKNV